VPPRWRPPVVLRSRPASDGPAAQAVAEGVGERPPHPARALDRVENLHVIGVGDALEAMDFADHQVARRQRRPGSGPQAPGDRAQIGGEPRRTKAAIAPAIVLDSVAIRVHRSSHPDPHRPADGRDGDSVRRQ